MNFNQTIVSPYDSIILYYESLLDCKIDNECISLIMSIIKIRERLEKTYNDHDGELYIVTCSKYYNVLNMLFSELGMSVDLIVDKPNVIPKVDLYVNCEINKDYLRSGCVMIIVKSDVHLNEPHYPLFDEFKVTFVINCCSLIFIDHMIENESITYQGTLHEIFERDKKLEEELIKNWCKHTNWKQLDILSNKFTEKYII